MSFTRPCAMPSFNRNKETGDQAYVESSISTAYWQEQPQVSAPSGSGHLKTRPLSVQSVMLR